MYTRKINEASNAIKTVYAAALKDAKPVVKLWRDQMKELEDICKMTIAINNNIALDIALSMALEDCMFDMEPDSIQAEDTNTDIVLNHISKKVNDYILTCGADERNITQSASKALYRICRNGKACLITEYFEKVLSDIDAFLEMMKKQ